MIRTGAIDATTMVWREGLAAWIPASNASEFACLFAAPQCHPFPPANAKSKLAAGLMGILLGGIGVHRFYLGFVGIGIAQIAVTLVTCGVGSLWGFIEGILLLTGSINRDAQGRPLRD
jgi:TM2 domain-containing membrane protein YozV